MKQKDIANNNSNAVDDIVPKIAKELEHEKEQKLVDLLIKIIVSSTLKEYYEKGDQISEI